MSEMAKKNDNDNGSEKEEQHNDNVSNHCGYQIHGLQRQRQSLSNQTDEERKMLIEEWSKFCSFCFSYKSNPPSCSYFQRHYYNDVHGSDNDKLHLIRIATAKTKTNKKEHEIKEETNIVSTVRIFQRNVSMMSSMLLENHYSTKDVNDTNEEENESKTDNATKNADNVATAMVEVLAGGIGEVCTHPQYRRQGLSFALLQNAIHIMESTLFDTTNDDDDDKASTKSKDNHTNNESHPTKQEQTTRTNTKQQQQQQQPMQISLLHASPQFFPVYQKAGYRNVISEWNIVSLRTSIMSQQQQQQCQQHSSTSLSSNNTTTIIRRAQFPKDTKQLQWLHHMYSEQRLWGCIVRSREYWNTYLSQELNVEEDTNGGVGQKMMSPLFVWTRTRTGDSHGHSHENENDDNEQEILAWLALRCFPQQPSLDDTTNNSNQTLQFQVREFGRKRMNRSVDDDGNNTTNDDCSGSVSTIEALSHLVPHAIQSILLKQDSSTITNTKMELKLPLFVLQEVQDETMENQQASRRGDDDEEGKSFLSSSPPASSIFDWSTPVQSDNDEGWMYRPLQQHGTTHNAMDNSTFKNFVESSTVSSGKRPHLIWPSDSF